MPSTVLNEVTVMKVNRSVCEARYRLLEEIHSAPFPVTNTMICAGILDVGGKLPFNGGHIKSHVR